MLPFVVGGGIMIALAFLLDDYTIDPSNFGMNTPVAAFFKTVGSAAFGYMLPILAGFIAMSIADRPGLAVGFAGGVLAMNVIAAVEGEDGRLLRAIHAGLQRHFARVEVFCVTDPRHPGQLQNLMVLAFSDAATATVLRDGTGHSPEMAAMLACRYRPSLPAAEPLRDDFAPVERFALSLLRRP